MVFYKRIIRKLSMVSVFAFSCNDIGLEFEKLAKDDWLELRSKNFIVVTDIKEKDARHLIKDLEEYRYFAVEMLRLDGIKSTPPLLIFAIGKSRNFKKLELPEDYAGVFFPSRFGPNAIANVKGYRASSTNTSFGRHTLLHE